MVIQIRQCYPDKYKKIINTIENILKFGGKSGPYNKSGLRLFCEEVSTLDDTSGRVVIRVKPDNGPPKILR